jgi:4-cresol dehydrogenase (hydroxylating) flavoprotein subunit
MGKNNAYGGPAPRVRGSVVVSMRRLNRVLEVNEDLAYAVVEPGVSFFDLCAELRRRGSGLWASIPDLGAMAGNPAWHAHRKGFGPSVDSLFMQSNFGIVTRMGKWLTPRPEVYAPVEVRAGEETDLEALIDTIRPLLLDGTVTNVPLLGTLAGAASMTRPRAQWHAGGGPLPPAFYERARAELGLGYWNLRDRGRAAG